MMIPTYKCQPKKCLDCGKPLAKKAAYSPVLGSENRIHLDCKCGAIYIWSWDETGQNGGVWKRRHILPIFDDRKRIELR